MKKVFGKPSSVVSVDRRRMPERVETGTVSESVQVSAGNVTELTSDSPQDMRELVSDFLPVPTK